MAKKTHAFGHIVARNNAAIAAKVAEDNRIQKLAEIAKAENVSIDAEHYYNPKSAEYWIERLSLPEKLDNFRNHSEAMDRATEQKRPYSYIYQTGGHCPMNY